MLEKKSYNGKIEFDFGPDNKFIACFVERVTIVLEDGKVISSAFHRDIVGLQEGLEIIRQMGFT